MDLDFQGFYLHVVDFEKRTQSRCCSDYREAIDMAGGI
jgi:hypothetical protein